MKIRAKLCAIAGLVISSLVSISAHAALFIDVRDGDTASVPVSIKDPTRLTLQGGKILKLYGDIYDKESNQTGRVQVMPDPTTGEVHLQPTKVDGQFKPVKVDVRTERGTFGLLIEPAQIPGDTVVMVNKGKATPSLSRTKDSVSTQVAEVKRADVPEVASSNYLRAIKGWMLAMSTNTAPEQIEVRPIGREIALWKESLFTLDDSWLGKQWVGDRFTLINKSNQAMVLDEREFYRTGVLAVTIAHHQLEPGASTPVWVLRTRTEQE